MKDEIWNRMHTRATVIGIDPGLSGAIVLMQNGAPIEWLLMPTMKSGTTNRVNGAALRHALRTTNDHISLLAVVEDVHAMPGQGVSSTFNFGHACGVVLGVLAAMEIPVKMVSPQLWKKRAGLIGTDKDTARTKAIQTWPGWTELNQKARGQALADAALIAMFGAPNE